MLLQDREAPNLHRYLDIEAKSMDRDDLGDVDAWHHSEYLMRGCNGVGRWDDLQLRTVDTGGIGAKSII